MARCGRRIGRLAPRPEPALESGLLRSARAWPPAASAPRAAASSSRAPFVATPPDVVERMLTLARVGPGDVVYDLGCGDGRIVIAAAQKFGARGVGVDIDPARIAEAEAERQAGRRRAARDVQAAGRAEDRRLRRDGRDALPAVGINVKLRPILTTQLRPGARIVSHNFAMGDWEPDVVDTFTDAEERRGRCICGRRTASAAVE